MPKCAIAISPWLDHTLTSESFTSKEHIDPLLAAKEFPKVVQYYMNGADAKSLYASPIFHSLKNLPPVYVQVGEEEILLSDSTTFAEKAKADGVDVRLEVYPEMFHVFNAFWKILPKAREANKKLGEFMHAQLFTN